MTGKFYIPRESWFGDPQRCREAGIPGEVTFATRPEQVRAMIERVVAAGCRSPGSLRTRNSGRIPGCANSWKTRTSPTSWPSRKARGHRHGWDQKTIAETRPDYGGTLQRRACGIGTKGFRGYDWALIAAPAPDFKYMIRRSLDDGELPITLLQPPPRAIRRARPRAGSRWPVEECFEAAKKEAGLDKYQVRLYHAWYRHVTLSMLALTFLAVIRADSKKGTRDLWTTFRS